MYQIIEASCHWFVVAEEMQPSRSVRAWAVPRRERVAGRRENKVGFILEASNGKYLDRACGGVRQVWSNRIEYV
jgi:hypothetical protein